MFYDKTPRRFIGAPALSVALFGAATLAAVGAAHPALATQALIHIQGIVTCATTGNTGCVSGTNTSWGAGVLGTSTGPSGRGVLGVSTSGAGVAGTSTTGSGVFGKSKSSFGVWGESDTNYGVLGGSTANDGIVGSTASDANSGVVGSSPGGFGVFGYTTGSKSGTAGVYGVSNSSYGVYGTTHTAGIGVLGDNPSQGFGVWGRSRDRGDGVVATSAGSDGTGLYASGTFAIRAHGRVVTSNDEFNGNGADITGANIGVIGRSPGSGWPLVLTDTADNAVFFVDGQGNVSYSGALTNFAKIAGGAHVRAFSPKTTLPTVEDTGTAQLAGGSGVVRLDPAFAASIDRSSAYRVFLTPNGDTHGLFVAEKTANGFLVRESQGGRSTVTFDFRIVATALGQAGQRMAVSTAATGLPRVASPALPEIKLPPLDAPVPLPAVPRPAGR